MAKVGDLLVVLIGVRQELLPLFRAGRLIGAEAHLLKLLAQEGGQRRARPR